MRIVICLLVMELLTGCLTTGVSSIDADPEFNWDTLKRDEILMSPLVDLRLGGGQPFFADKDRLAYAEEFKQVFFKLRKDIRVFGAGGAFTNFTKVENLPDLARKVLSKEPLPDADVARLKAGSQDIRFVFFFAVTAEHLSHDYSYEFRSDQRDDVARYISRRELTVKLALWDSSTNKTVWIATKNLTPQDVNTVSVPNSSKRRVKKGDRYVWEGSSLYSSLARELEINRNYFPQHPEREPTFSKSFDDFALSLPLQPSEAKLIEYEHFTHHRPEAGLRAAAIGKETTVNLFLGSSSVINYHLRLGGGLLVPLNSPTIEFEGEDVNVTMLAYGATFDYETELSPTKRLLAGVFAGGAAFTMAPDEEPPLAGSEDPDAPKEDAVGDGTFVLWPRVHLLFGEKSGFQWGVGGAYRFFDGIEEPFLKANRPAPWSLDLNVAYAFRGF